jgi:protein-S-isoprenylcysteine O-methyltransferase Ste14
MQEIAYFVELFHFSVIGLVTLSWIGLTAAYFLRKRPPSPPERKRGGPWATGFALQGLGYAVIGIEPRWRMTSSLLFEFTLDLAALLLLAGAVWIMVAAVPALGRQYGIPARIVEGHELVTHGPYALVRHPIYSGMTGILLATGLALGRFGNLVIAAPLFAAGTALRILSEEKLLRETFEAEYKAYAERVPAVVPALCRRPR